MKYSTIEQNNTNLNINNKDMKLPSFFMISNLGGGGSDKYRETVYLDLFKNSPTLYNFHYLRESNFANIWLSQIDKYNTFGEFIDFTRNSMINDKQYYSNEHTFESYNSDQTVFLLDSGAANIINNLLKTTDMNSEVSSFNNETIKIMKEYYDFANKFKFDIVIGFDIGGKYTSKGDERSNQNIIDGNLYVKENSSDINNMFLEESIKYIQSKDDFYPLTYATVHGSTAKEYLENINFIVEMEKKYNFKFDGFALGGIASSKSINKADWNIDDKAIRTIKSLVKGNSNSGEVYNTIISSFACRIVREVVGDRPIHALGAGGKLNIIPLYFSGATSFDSQTPGRRAYDGNGPLSGKVLNPNIKGSFSKYLVGLIDKNLNLINKDVPNSYEKLNIVDNSIQSCGCITCSSFSIDEIRQLYSRKEESNEHYYYARQLLNAHNIWQHNYLCDLCRNSSSEDILSKFNDDPKMQSIFKYILFDFDYKIKE